MNLLALREYVNARYPSSLTVGQIDAHINEGYRDLARLFTPDHTEESTRLLTLENQAIYLLAEPAREIKSVHITLGGRRRLRLVDEEVLVYPRASGLPQRWYHRGVLPTDGGLAAFGLDPVPDALTAGRPITVLFEPSPVNLAVETDVPLYIPEEHHAIIAWEAMSLIAGSQLDYAVAQYWTTRYRDAYNAILTQLGKTAPAQYPEATKGG